MPKVKQAMRKGKQSVRKGKQSVPKKKQAVPQGKQAVSTEKQGKSYNLRKFYGTNLPPSNAPGGPKTVREQFSWPARCGASSSLEICGLHL